MCPAVPNKLPAPTKPGAGVVIALPTAAFACIAAPVGELPATPVFLSVPNSTLLVLLAVSIPSALPWLLGPCLWLLPGIIASNYTTRRTQPLRYHAKIQQDLITTSRVRFRLASNGLTPRRAYKNEFPKTRWL